MDIRQSECRIMEEREMLLRIKNNAKYIFTRFTIIASMIFGLISIMQMFVDWDVLGEKGNNTKCKIIIFCLILVSCIVIALIWGVFFSNSRSILVEDEVHIVVKYGDLLKIAFPKKYSSEKIVVIAVNRCFDTIVDQDLIKADSMHGQFLRRFVADDAARQRLDDAIDSSLQEFEIPYETINRSDKRYGKLKRYPLGSVARINGENGITFFLLALTSFDRDCVAHCNRHEYVECLLKLFEYYDAHGQGRDLYLYPMGTKMARTGLSKKEALDTTVTLTKISKEYLKSKTTIIVDRRNKNEISIMDL